MSPLAPADLDLMPPLLRSLATLMRLRGRPVSPRFLMAGLDGGIAASGTAACGVSPAACLRAAGRAGLHGRIVPRARLADISPLTLPCVLLLHADRAAVLTACSATEATVIFSDTDPVPMVVPCEALEKEYTGFALFGMPDPAAGPGAEFSGGEGAFATEGLSGPQGQADTREGHRAPPFSGRGTRWFRDVLAHYGPIYRHTAFASVIINLIGVASPLFVMNVYDRVVPNKAVETLWVLAMGIGIAYLFDALLRVLRTHFVDTAGRNADVVLSSLLLDKVLTMRLSAKPDSTGALVNNIREFEAVREFFSSSTLLACVDLPFMFLFLGLMAFIGGELVLLPLLAMPIMLFSGLILQRLARRGAEQAFRHGMHKNALLVEMVNGLETIKVCQAESRMQRLWERVCGLSAKAGAENRGTASLAVVISTLVTQMVTVGITVWGVYLIADGRMTMGGLIGCNILVGRAMAPLLQMAQLITRLQQSRMALNALHTLMSLPSERYSIEGGMDFGSLLPEFALQDVQFAYPGTGRPALDGVGLHIGAGEKVGVVGAMGSGKSTLGRLLAGLYFPDEGTVRFGGVDIRQLACADVRGRIGVLPQEVTLFHGTIRDNIALGNPIVNDALILRAAELAGVTDFVREFPAGFGTPVGEQGKALSGGQRQAVALARALVSDPEVLILDEPTSNMDTAAEERAQKRLAAVMGGKTVLVITHRPSLLRMVDRIVVLDKGRIILDAPRDAALRQLGFLPPVPRPVATSAAAQGTPATRTVSGNVADLFAAQAKTREGGGRV